MKRLFILIPIIAILAGCSSPAIFGNASNKVERQADKIVSVQQAINLNNDKKVIEVQQFSWATSYALDSATNTEPAISVAKEMNSRVEQIMGLPEFAQEKAMQDLVNGLISNNISSKSALNNKDKIISFIQHEKDNLVQQKNIEITKALQLSKTTAFQADASQAQLSKYKGWGGLSAIFMGLKQLLARSLWTILGFGAVFLVLRLLSVSNPVAAAIFSIFDTFFAWVIGLVKVIAPKALALAGTVTSKVYNASNSALTSIVDSIETVKMQGAASGTTPTIQDLLNTAELSMTPADKALIEQIKIKLNWTKPITTTTVVQPLAVTTPVVASTTTPATITVPVTEVPASLITPSPAVVTSVVTPITTTTN
jgi:hypothetical protein